MGDNTTQYSNTMSTQHNEHTIHYENGAKERHKTDKDRDRREPDERKGLSTSFLTNTHAPNTAGRPKPQPDLKCLHKNPSLNIFLRAPLVRRPLHKEE